MAEIWRKDPNSENVLESLYMATAKEVEFAFNEKLNFNTLSEDDAVELYKFFFMTYQRATTAKNTLSLKPAKLLPIQQELIDKNGIGSLHRALFTTEKKAKKKGAEED